MRTKEIAHISWQLEMIQAHFALAILEESFDVPAREGDVEEGLQRDLGICVGEEVLRFTAEDVSGDDESLFSARDAAVVREEPCLAYFPDFGTLLRVLDPVERPRRPPSFPELRDCPCTVQSEARVM